MTERSGVEGRGGRLSSSLAVDTILYLHDPLSLLWFSMVKFSNLTDFPMTRLLAYKQGVRPIETYTFVSDIGL